MFESAQLNRSFKWSDSLADRLSFKNTRVGNMVYGIKTKKEAKQVLEDLAKEGFYYIKFSSWTRGSPFVDKLIQWF